MKTKSQVICRGLVLENGGAIFAVDFKRNLFLWDYFMDLFLKHPETFLIINCV
jgi:hypothetical protein